MSNRENPLQDYIDQHKGQQMGVPLAYYEELFAQADPEALARRCGVAFQWSEEGKRGSFSLKVLGRPMNIVWPSLAVTYDDEGPAPADKEKIIIADLLLHGQLVPTTGKFIPYSDVPWGNHYLKAFQGRCIQRLAYMFKSADQFMRACERLGGIPSEGGDASYDFDFVGGVWIRLTMWEADEEFPPSAQILFSDNAPLAFTAEDLAVVGDITLGVLKALRD